MYDHSKCALHCGVGQSTTKHDIFVIIVSPLEVRNRDKKTLHESNKKRSNNNYATLRNQIFNQCQDPRCNVTAFTGAGTVTDPTISPFHIRTTSINGTRKNWWTVYIAWPIAWVAAMLRMYYSVASVFLPPTILTTTLETTASYIWEVFCLT